jgi:hypothetical protein
VILAHVAGLPLEEIAPMLAGTGAGLLLARAWLVHLPWANEKKPRQEDPDDLADHASGDREVGRLSAAP